MTIGTDEGEQCGRLGCTGELLYEVVENCSCHIAAPCNACMSVELYCPHCGMRESDEYWFDGI